MKYIKFKKFKGENFKNHVEPIGIDIPESGIILISGPNGVGKTSIIEILFFTFFGRTPTRLTSNDVVNNKMGKNCVTSVEFDVIEEDGTKDEYKCTRYCKYKSLGNKVVLSKNDNKNYKVGQQEVIKELGVLCSWDRQVFLNTLFFGQKVKDFFMDLEDSKQKDIFKSILKTEDYEKYKETTKSKLDSVKDKLDENEKNIQVNNSLIEESNNQILRLEKEKENFYSQKDLELQEIEKVFQELQKEYDKLILEKDNTNIEKLKEEIDYLVNSKSNIENKLSSIEESRNRDLEDLKNKFLYKKSELESKYQENKNIYYEEYNNELQNQNNIVNEELDNLQDELNKVNEVQNSLNIKYNELKTNIENIDKTIDFLFKDDTNKILSGELSNCPLCKNEIDNKTIEKIRSEINEFKEQKESYSTELNKLDPYFNKVKQDKDEIEQKKNNAKNEFRDKKANLDNEYNKKVNELNNRLKDSISKLEKFTEDKKIEVRQKYDEQEKDLISQLEEKNKQIETCGDKINTYHEIKNRLIQIENEMETNGRYFKNKKEQEFDNSQIDYYSNKISEYQREINNLNSEKEELKKRIEILEFWKKGFSNSGIPSMLVDEAIPFMNRIIRSYLEDMTFGRYSVTFDTLKQNKSGEFKDKISVNVFDNLTSANLRQQFSGGQTRVIDIATILTLSELQSYIQNIKTNLLIFDEVFDALDDNNIMMVSKALRKIATEKVIIVISHVHVDSLEAEEVLRLSN